MIIEDYQMLTASGNSQKFDTGKKDFTFYGNWFYNNFSC